MGHLGRIELFSHSYLAFVFLVIQISSLFPSQGARMVRELFEMARSKKACIIFFDEIDAVGGLLRMFCCFDIVSVMR